jgi:hypothetical protein
MTGRFFKGNFAHLLTIFAGLAGSAGALPWTDAWRRQPDPETFRREYPVEWDWLRQDGGTPTPPGTVGAEMALRAAAALPAGATGAGTAITAATKAGWPAADPRWLDLYARACEERRTLRLATAISLAPQVAFVRRRSIRPSFFAYTEGQSDAQAERHFHPGSALCQLTFAGTRTTVTELLADPGGAIRDPAVSWDGGKLAFAWKKSLDGDDYHLYELDLKTRALRQVTAGRGVADYEPAYLPNNDFIFASSRCVQTVDCWWTEVSNLYTCDPSGGAIRRLGYDQVHTVFPQVLDDGRVIYTRWDYNDRGQVFPQPLFQMHPDGTGQSEFYGNSSWFPTTIAHARGIPGTAKVLAVLCGHHTSQAGKLAVIDPAQGRQENQGVQLVSPARETKAERIDAYGQQGELFAYPFPLNEREWLVSYAPDGWDIPRKRAGDAAFGLYWMDRDGNRELLVPAAELPCLQPVAIAPRARPTLKPSTVNLANPAGYCYIRDIYQGEGLAGVPRGTVRKLRVVALEFRPAGIRSNHSSGPAGGALVSTPVAIGNGTWDVKRVLGDTPVLEDGSAYFAVPARTPVYFQALDERGRAVQTMRSWTTLQPGETASCVGCHDTKNTAPPPHPATAGALALRQPPRPLTPFYGPPRGFSFAREIQPILDRNCVRCHHDREAVLSVAAGNRPPTLEQAAALRSPGERRAFSLSGDTVRDEPAGRAWSDAYLVLTQAKRDGAPGRNGPFRGKPDGRMVRWLGSQSEPGPQPPYASGAAASDLLELLAKGHHGVRLTREDTEKIACWIDLFVPFGGDYTEANIWNEAELAKFRRYEAKRRQFAAAGPP